MKKLLLSLLLVPLFVIPASAQVDSTKLFVYCTAFGAFPTDRGAAEWNPHAGVQFEFHYPLGDRFTIGGTYKNWKLQADANPTDLYAEHRAVILTYWVNKYGLPFNIGFAGEGGQALISNEAGEKGNLGMVYAMIVTKSVYNKLHIVGTLKLGKFGTGKEDAFGKEVEQDHLMISLGIGAPISF